jgi:hypothetical protein
MIVRASFGARPACLLARFTRTRAAFRRSASKSRHSVHAIVAIHCTTVCRIEVSADPRAHCLDNKLYARLGNATEELTGRTWRTGSGGEIKQLWQRAS